jgi:predicted ATP-dependent endonuclease of OLD family
LHPRGQKDVLNVIEKITQNNQLVYSTHSPFLINRNYPHRIRLLTKDAEKGTIINNKPYSDGKTRFWEPLRSSIGVCLGDMLSIGEKNIVVEGISEQIIITRLSKKFAELNLPFIDLEKFSVVPAMGATCEETLTRLALSEGLTAISLLDNDSEGQRVARHLQKDKQIKLLSIGDIKKDAITIEDLFPEDEYINAFNHVYSRFDDFKEYIKVKSEDEKTKGIVEKLEKYLKSINYSKLDKVAVANSLITNLELNDKNISLYSSFQRLFADLTKL